MRHHTIAVLALLAFALPLAGCDRARPLPVAGDRPSKCVACHGGELDSTGAPPLSLPRNAAGQITAGGTRFSQADSTTRIEVGAHRRHVERGVSCGACHQVPAQVTAPGHNTGKRATVVFKELAAAGNVIPSVWVPADHTCTNYCHGSSLNHGGTNHTPDWLGGAAAAACGTCHFAAGATPPAPHPQGPDAGGAFASTTACITCHPDTVNVDGTINVTGGKHVNGQLDGGGGHAAGWADPTQHGRAANAGLPNCKSCHGNDFGGGSSGVSCNACHASAGHPSWQTECTFCHGSATRAADATFPSVGAGVVVRANLAAPPVGSQGENTIIAYAVGAHQAHVGGGTLARPALCLECHGPDLPGDTAHADGMIVLGWSATGSTGVVPTPVAAGNYPRWSDTNLQPGGANCTNFCHGATLAGGSHTSPKWNEGPAGVVCGSCHAVPLPYSAAGRWHVQRQDCETCHPGYTSGSVNLADHVFVGAGPSGLTCTSCHGSSLANAAPPTDITGATSGGNAIGAHQAHLVGSTGTPRWRSTAIACGECHPDNSGNNLHANGQVNISWGPVASANTSYPVAPANGGFARGAAFPTCTVYCHNPRSTDTGATSKAPSWTGAATQAQCGSCHGLPPVGTGHVATNACSTCHDGYADAPTSASNASAVSLGNHLNGAVNVVNLTCTTCHGQATGRTAVASAIWNDVNGQNLVLAAPPVDHLGAAAGNLVGAHLAHVNQGAASPALSYALRCENCHSGLVWTTAPHATPANPVAFGNIALAGLGSPTPYSTATRSCASTYCHGNFNGGKGAVSIGWGNGTPAKLACNACHGQGAGVSQPTYPHPQNTTCSSCHAGYSSTAVGVATHVDGLVSKITSGCTGCHGELGLSLATVAVPLRSAPGATGTSSFDTLGLATGNAVGAHKAHLVGNGAGSTPRWRGAAIACTECHPLPVSDTDTAHATGSTNILWGPIATTNSYVALPGNGGFTPGAAFPTCTNFCHNPRSGDTAATNKTPSWTGAATTVACGSCHGLPPTGTGHTTSTACSGCHDGYANAPTAASLVSAVSLGNHINGVVNVGNLSCTSCHGTAGRTLAGADPQLPYAPPVAATSALAVGAHLAHVFQADTVAPGPLSSPLLCANCHSGMVYITAPHATPANPVAYGNVALAGLGSPTGYVTATQTCASTYCHGNFSGGKGAVSITWGAAGKLACNACHGQGVGVSQPTYPHPQNTTCSSCHVGYSSTTVGVTTHVDGLVSKVTAGCTGCHGELGPSLATAAVPLRSAPGATGSGTNSFDTTGATATSVAGVGAHQAHLVGSTGTPRWRSSAIACTECHLVPADGNTGHATGVGTGVARATLTFGALAGDNAFETKTASYVQPTCSSVYCHGPKSTDTATGQSNAPAWNGASTLAQCGSCHGLPPVTAAHPTGVTECGSCHPGYAVTMPTSASTIAQVNALSHINGQLDGGGDCTGCHATAQPMAAGGTRRAVVPEFALAWSHKRSAGGTVTKWDCIVCHMEGDPTTGNTTAVHKDGVINLRDPDTGLNIKGVTFTDAAGASPGAYATTGTDLTFTRFSRNLGVTLETDPAAPALQAIMINQCLKCHDGNGALSPSARVPTTGTAEKPFGTTIAGAGYSGVGVTANGVAGGVADVNESFKATNSSYHPVTGKQNNWYAKLTRMAAPWNAAARGATVNTTSWGPLISCWDCHAPDGTASTVTLTATVTAHGGVTTLRGSPTAPTTGTAAATTNEATLCKVCHAGYDSSTASSHGTGSALSSGTNGTMTAFLRWGCNRCHSSNYTTAVVRPVRAQDVHGVNALPPAGTKTGRWAGTSTGTPAQVNASPYAFIRNTTSLSNHQPARIGGSTYTPTCVHLSNSPCSARTETYTAGGTY